MGYNTRYTIVSVDGDVMKFRDAFSRHKTATDSGYRFFGIGVSSSPIKWYEHDQHIVDVMAAANALEVVLHGEGEESGDVWEKRYSWKDGAVQIDEFKVDIPIGKMIERADLKVATKALHPEHIARVR